jgi:Spy/CpxP family protein refolding chaperone
MKRNWVLLTIALVVLALTANQVMAQPAAGGAPGQGAPGQGGPGGRGGMGMRGMGQDMYDQVGLTDAQKAKMEELRTKFTKDLESATPETRREIFTNMRTEMEKVLTPEQKTKMDELRAQRGPGFGGPGGAGAGGPNRGSMFPFQPLLDRIKLTDEQKAKITALQRKAIEELFNQIRKEVLTPEQQKELEKIRTEQPAPGAAQPGAPKPDAVKPAPADKPAATPADKPAPANRPARGQRRGAQPQQ